MRVMDWVMVVTCPPGWSTGPDSTLCIHIPSVKENSIHEPLFAFVFFMLVCIWACLFLYCVWFLVVSIKLTTDFHREPHTWFNFSCTKPFMAQHWHTKLDLALNPIWVRWTSRPFQASRQTRGAPLHQSSLSYCPKRTYLDTQIPGWIPCPFFASFFWVSQE